MLRGKERRCERDNENELDPTKYAIRLRLNHLIRKYSGRERDSGENPKNAHPQFIFIPETF